MLGRAGDQGDWNTRAVQRDLQWTNWENLTGAGATSVLGGESGCL